MGPTRPIALLLLAACLPCCKGRSAGAPDVPGGEAAAAPADAGSRGRLVILALDGVDPDWLDGWISDHRLPAFERLRGRMSSYRLRTTTPPTCEAAWTAFVTGSDPGDSGVFGPVRMDPATYLPVAGAVDVDLARTPPLLIARRSGSAFWRILGDAGVRVRVLWAPWEVPPEPVQAGEVLAGAGVPDLAGAGGSDFLLGAAFPDRGGEAAPRERARLVPSTAGWTGEIPGPPLPGGIRGRMAVPVAVRRADDLASLVVAVGGAEAAVGPGAWSPRLPVTFAAQGLKVDGLVRFLAVDAGDSPMVLVGPIEIDPLRPWLQVSEPGGYLTELAGRSARVPTTGSPGDLWALERRLIGEEPFIADIAEDLVARREVLLGEIRRGGYDLLVAFVPTAERLTKGLYRFSDASAPGWDAAAAERQSPAFGGVRLRDAVLAGYAFLDDVVGRAAEALRPEDTLLILSDHGFQPYRRSVHLNAWLRREGLLLLLARDSPRPGAPAGAAGPRGVAEIDWTRTQAYAVGHGAVWVNLRGRQARGVVEPGERYDTLVGRTAAKLEALTDDGANGARIVSRVLVRGRDFAGRRDDLLPDLLVVFEPGYRTSDETAAGLVPDAIVEDNRSVVGADHSAADAAETGGVLLSTRPLAATDPGIEDVGASALGFFGVAGDTGRGGRDFWKP